MNVNPLRRWTVIDVCSVDGVPPRQVEVAGVGHGTTRRRAERLVAQLRQAHVDAGCSSDCSHLWTYQVVRRVDSDPSQQAAPAAV